MRSQSLIWNPSVKIAAAFLFLTGLIVAVVNAREIRYQREHGPALIAELQRRFTPSPELLALDPEMRTSRWTATYRAANCTFSNPSIDKCWEIHFIVWVPGVPGVMQGRRQVEANWIVDQDRMEFTTNAGGNRLFRRTEGQL